MIVINTLNYVYTPYLCMRVCVCVSVCVGVTCYIYIVFMSRTRFGFFKGRRYGHLGYLHLRARVSDIHQLFGNRVGYNVVICVCML